MRKSLLKVCKKVDQRLSRIYTWLWRSSLKSCGRNVLLEYPVRLEQPGSITMGDDVILYPRVWLNPVAAWANGEFAGEIRLGNRVKLAYGVQISSAKSVIIEDDVAIAAGAVIVDHNHDHRYIGSSIFDAPISEPRPVRIGKGSFLGVHCLIAPGVQIGEHAVIAANAVVLKDVPSYCIAAGNPARVTRFYDPEANKKASPAMQEDEVAVG
jgi:acetyltransferase-like isoleucine patch superfamily enzyme